jgi:SAM-dependent methyltransferase
MRCEPARCNWIDADKVLSMEPPLGVVRVWRPALHESFARLDREVPAASSLLDVGGGHGPLAALIDSRIDYVLLDKSADCIARATVPRKIVADATAMPFDAETFDVAISISTAQYIDHDKLLAECRRVLKRGGTLALHENGSFNPIILMARLASHILALRRPALRAYNRSITGYLNDAARADGFELTHSASYGLLSPIAFVLELAGARRWSEVLAPKLVAIDTKLLKFAPLRRLAWFRVFHLRRL